MFYADLQIIDNKRRLNSADILESFCYTGRSVMGQAENALDK
jgi:hypothetical protein